MTTETDPRDQGRRHARAVWDAAVNAVRPAELVADILTGPCPADPVGTVAGWVRAARRVLVLGGGKAGAGMADGAERALADRLDRVSGVVNVPADTVRPLRAVRLHAARPAGLNEPTAEGAAGTAEMLALAEAAGPDDLALCLLSGGGSALLPAPADGVSLDDKQAVTRLLHRSGATITEMNCVRKHLSRFKGGRLAAASRAGRLVSLVVSDVVGDPLDVIASGPTVADPTTFADALTVLARYGLIDQAPAAVRRHLEDGATGRHAETPKRTPDNVHNVILGSNHAALTSAERAAAGLGYRVVNLGAFVEGETAALARVVVGLVRGVRAHGRPAAAPTCLLIGGETTVTLPPQHGRGGRNQEFVLAALTDLGDDHSGGVTVLSGGTDGEDGPTDAAGAVGDAATLAAARRLGLAPADSLTRHDAYSFFAATGDLLRTGPTGTNVMDVRVVLIAP